MKRTTSLGKFNHNRSECAFVDVIAFTVGAKTVDRAKTLDPDTLPIHFEHLKLSKQPDFFTC